METTKNMDKRKLCGDREEEREEGKKRRGRKMMIIMATIQIKYKLV